MDEASESQAGRARSVAGRQLFFKLASQFQNASEMSWPERVMFHQIYHPGAPFSHVLDALTYDMCILTCAFRSFRR